MQEKTELRTEILLSQEDIKNISITCRCGHKSVHQVLKVLVNAGQRVVLRCKNEACKQAYGLGRNSVFRLTDDLIPDFSHKIIKSETPVQVTAERIHREHDDSGSKEPPVIKGTFVTNPSKAVN